MTSRWARARLGATFALGILATTTPLGAQGTIRELDCRGNTGMVLRVDQDPSPRDTAYVTMVLEYKRATSATGDDLRTLDPGTCSWNPGGWADFPIEPGRVRFDVQREAQPWSATETRILDTTVRAAVFYPDPITLPRYLLDPKHYWKFYVDDETGFSPSSQALFESGTPTYVTVTGPVVVADVRRDLICRGGTSGLLWGGGASAGNNLAKVQLSYKVSPNVPGATGGALAPGSCAWTDRTAMPAEPGRIWFITASNAQLRQTQSGVPLDQSPTAAERYPDVRSIPVYLQDPAHYWTFSVMGRDPDSALTNGVWKPDFGNVVAGGLRDPGTSTVRTQPTTSGVGGQTYTPGGAGSTSQVQSVFDIRNVTVTPGLEGVAIKFEAAANSNPTVTIVPSSFGTSIPLVVGSSAAVTAGMMRYSAASTTRLPRNTRFDYVISAPATANARLNATTGAFKTLGQGVTVAFSEINLVSDGDADSPGELEFNIEPCPRYLLTHIELGQAIRAPLEWESGRHRIDEKMTSYADTVPDRFRVVVLGAEEDRDESGQDRDRDIPPIWTTYCIGDGPAPGRNSDYEWNSLMLDFDLTKYPGAQGGEQFYRRSKALRNGSTLMFEVRGYIQVIRR